jgi:acetyl esterase/lipase
MNENPVEPAADSDHTSIPPINDKNYWYDRLHEDFRSMSRIPEFNIDSWCKKTLFHLMMKMAPSPRTPCEIIKQRVPGFGVLYHPNNYEYKERPPAAVLWIHGGGRIMGACDNSADIKICQHLCKELDMPVLSASYRLAPKHPFPAALDDLVEAYKWLVDRLRSDATDDMKQRPIRIAVAGESAGGGLAAELCQKLLDQQQESSGEGSLPLPVTQLLIYPMLDDRTCADMQYNNLPSHLICNNKSNRYGWSSYFGPNHKPGDERLPDYMSASRRTDLSNLPPAYIFCGTLDLFLDECRDYARRLEEHGVPVDYDELVGGFHAMMSIGYGKDAVVRAWKNLVAFGKKYLKATEDR